MTTRERMLVRTAMAAALLGAVGWGYARLANARDAANDAAGSLAECRQLAAQIEARRGAAPVAGTSEPQPGELVKRIESAAKIAEFPDSSIERIEPTPARRVPGENEDDTLREKPTIVQLRNVNLRQLFTFLHAAGGIGTGRPGLQLKDVRLTAPNMDDTTDRWSVEGTLTYLVRSPKESGRTN